MKLIIGLGNPGKAYVNNRHNVGFRCIDHLARVHHIPWSKRKGRAKIGSGEMAEAQVVLAKPQTFMNLSGRSVRLLVRHFAVPVEDVVVIYDDLNLPLGKVRIRRRGSAGGHKGVQSIIASLRSEEFPRIRVGIGRPDGDEVSYVLSDFSAEERKLVTEAVRTVAAAINSILSEGIEAAMNRYN